MIRKFFSMVRGKPDPASEALDPGAPQPLSHKPNVAAKKPEVMCGIEPKKMSRDEIKAKLAELYKRHNHAAGSLNDELREEAEIMLDAIVACREKYVDKE
jgi:hypothetical protein